MYNGDKQTGRKGEGRVKIKRFVGGSLESNCYIIRTTDGKHCFIIDPGYEPQRIIDFVKKSGFFRPSFENKSGEVSENQRGGATG